MGKLIESAFQLKLFFSISQTYMRTGMQLFDIHMLWNVFQSFKKNKS